MSSANAASSSSSGDAHMEAYLARSQTRLHIAQLTEAESQEEKAHAVEGLAKFLLGLRQKKQFTVVRELSKTVVRSVGTVWKDEWDDICEDVGATRYLKRLRGKPELIRKTISEMKKYEMRGKLQHLLNEVKEDIPLEDKHISIQEIGRILGVMWRRGYRADVGLLSEEVSDHVQNHCDQRTSDALTEDIKTFVQTRDFEQHTHQTKPQEKRNGDRPAGKKRANSPDVPSSSKRSKPSRVEEQTSESTLYNAVEGLAPMTAKQAIAYALRHPETPVRFYNAHQCEKCNVSRVKGACTYVLANRHTRCQECKTAHRACVGGVQREIGKAVERLMDKGDWDYKNGKKVLRTRGRESP